MSVTRNSRNSRAVQCNWKFPNCKNRTRDNSTYCQVHRSLAARLSGDNLMYGRGETEIGNRSRFTSDPTARGASYNRVSQVLESYPVINIKQVEQDGKTIYRASINQLTKADIEAHGIEIKAHHKDGFENTLVVNRDTEDEALYEATTVASQAWGRRVEALESENPDLVDIYDSAVEAIAYSRDWSSIITELEMKHSVVSTGRSISFSHNPESNGLSMKVYHQDKTKSGSHDYVVFGNLIRAIPQNDGSVSYIPNTVIEWEQSYSSEDGKKKNRFPAAGGQFTSPITVDLINRASRLVADSNKFGVDDTDGRLKIPTGWELRSKAKE